jgi:hypothetical protein
MFITETPSVQRSYSATSEENNFFPRGLKIALLASSTALALFVGLIVMLFVLSAESLNIPKIKTIAASFMKVSDPLPGGYEYTSGLDLLGLKVVLISHPTTGSSWTIVHAAAAEGSGSPESIIHQIEAAAESSRKMMFSPSKFTVSQKGAQDIGGRQFFYEAGLLLNGGNASGAIIGCFTPNHSGTTCIFGSTPVDKVNSFANDEFLNTINSI